MYCNSCGNSVVKGAKFCQHCGTKIEQDYKNETKPKRKLIVGFNATVLIITIFLISISSGIILKAYLKGNRIKESIQLGSEYLEEKDFDGAKTEFQQAISIDIKNKQVYLQIKDIYLENNRQDDAFYIIKLAINNNVDDKEITSAFDKIKQSFMVTNIKNTVFQKDSYTLPKEVPIMINNQEVKVPVKWNKDAVETEKLGTFNFDGIAEDYERPIKLTINVLPRIITIKDINVSIVQEEEFVLPLKVEAVMSDESTKEVEVNWNIDKANTKVPGTYNYEGKVEGYEKKLHLSLTVAPKPPTAHAVTKFDKIGYIKKVYEKGTKGFLQIDEVQFLTGDAAVEAAKKDGNAGYDESTHKYFVYNDYYIVNSNPRLRDYEILSTASINMLNILVSSEVQNVANTPVLYSQFKSIISDSDAGDLCHIYIENNVVVKIEGQYVP